MATDFTEVRDLIVQQGRDWSEFKRANDERVSRIDADLTQLSRDVATALVDLKRPAIFERTGTPAPRGDTWIDTKTHEPIRVYAPGESVAADLKSSEPQVSLGRYLRGLVVGDRAPDARELADERKALAGNSDAAGGYSIQGRLAAQFIDDLRAALAPNRAGAQTVVMDSRELAMAKLTSDATASWHGEGAPIEDSDATLGAVYLRAKTVVSLVKLSLELASDSANIETILRRSLTASLAHAIDSAGMQGVTTNAAAAPTGITQYAGRNTKTGIGAPSNYDFLLDGLAELMYDNVPTDSAAVIAHPKLWRKLAGLKTGLSGDETTLVMPPEVAALRRVWTTAAPLSGNTATAIMGNFADLMYGIRSDITVRVLSETYLGSNLQVAMLCYARCDFAPMHEKSFCTLEGLDVS